MSATQRCSNCAHQFAGLNESPCEGCVKTGDGYRTQWAPVVVVADAPAAAQTAPGGAIGARKHPHYFKDVSTLQTVDVYRVLSLFSVTDPCIQHAAKKLLCAGQRGAKDQAKDVQEAIDTLTRWQEMRAEDQMTEGK